MILGTAWKWGTWLCRHLFYDKTSSALHGGDRKFLQGPRLHKIIKKFLSAIDWEQYFRSFRQFTACLCRLWGADGASASAKPPWMRRHLHPPISTFRRDAKTQTEAEKAPPMQSQKRRQTAWHAVISAGIQLHFWDKIVPELEIWYEQTCTEVFQVKRWFEKGKHHVNLSLGEPERNPYSAPACISLGRQEGIKIQHNWSNSSSREGWICYWNIWKHSWVNFVASCPWRTGFHFGYILELNFIPGTVSFPEFHSRILDWQKSVMKQNHSTAVRQMNVPHIQKHFSVPQPLYLFPFLQKSYGEKSFQWVKYLQFRACRLNFRWKIGQIALEITSFVFYHKYTSPRRSEAVFILFPLHKGTMKGGDVPTQSRAPPSGSCNCCTKTLLPPWFPTEPLLQTCLCPPLKDKSETKTRTWFSGGLGWVNGWTQWSLWAPFNSGYSMIPWSWRSFPA